MSQQAAFTHPNSRPPMPATMLDHTTYLHDAHSAEAQHVEHDTKAEGSKGKHGAGLTR